MQPNRSVPHRFDGRLERFATSHYAHAILISHGILRWLATAAAASAALAHAQLDGSVIPIEHPAIGYRTEPLDNPVAALEGRLARGETKLAFDDRPHIGYLPDVLRELDVSVTSQLLVYSKTSLQQTLIAPQRPRAIYFNDELAVGAVQDGIIEIAVLDARQGGVFYTLERVNGEPRLARDGRCLGCHYALATLGVPGFFARSVPTAMDGQILPWLGNATVNHTTPLAERWGGWYVTGDIGDETHLGNALMPDRRTRTLPASPPGVPERLDGDIGAAWLAPYSDAVAHLVFEHQLEMMNVLTRVGWEARIGAAEGKPSETLARTIEDAVDYMLFVGEAPLGRVRSTSGFAEYFASLGPHDERGRSLRELQLDGRLMRYPLSYMIYSAAFDALPDQAREGIYLRLWQVLSGAVRDERYAALSAEDRAAIMEILVATKPGLPDYFRAAPGEGGRSTPQR
jgi:hypothetical protein